MKPGQFWSPDGSRIVRVKKRINGCEGCILDSPFICPNVHSKNSKSKGPDCALNGIIFTKP